MDFQELIRHRYSVRSYKPDAVEDDKLQQVLEAARLAPTAANRQPFRVIVVHTEGRQEELRRIYDKTWFVEAPIVMCVCGVSDETWVRAGGRSYLDVDVAIAMDHIILAAADLGLGTCWIGAFDAGPARELLGLPDSVEPIVFTPLGYPNDQLRPKTRRPLEELVAYERWQG